MAKIEISIADTISPLISTAEAKAHLRVDISDDDALIDAMVLAATNKASSYMWRELGNTEYLEYFDGYCGTGLQLTKAPVMAVSKVETWNGTAWVELPTTGYEVSAGEKLAWLRFIDSITTGGDKLYDTIRVTYTAGYETAADVPSVIVAAIYLILGHLYENREDVVVGRGVNELPKGSEYLMNAHRLFEFV